jgi:hypothetical protein
MGKMYVRGLERVCESRISKDVSSVSGDRFKSAERASFFPSHGSDALYQGPTFSRAAKAQQRSGLYRLRKNSVLYQGTTLVGP